MSTRARVHSALRRLTPSSGVGLGVAWPALAAAILFGASTPLAKALLGRTDPWLLAGLLYLGAGLGLAALRVGRRGAGRPGVEAPLRRPDLPWLALAVVSGGVVAPLLLMAGLARMQASDASLLLNLESVFTLVLAWVLLHEHVDRRIFLGAAAIVAGAFVLGWEGGALHLEAGAGLVALACAGWAVDNVATRQISGADPVAIVTVKGLVAGATNVALGLSLGAALPGAGHLAAALVVGFFGYGVSLVLFVRGLRALGAARTGAYFSTAPFFGAALAVLVLGEPVTVPLAVAAALMALGVRLHLAERHDHPHVHEPLAHEHLHVHDAHHQHVHAPGDPPGEPHAHPHRHEPLAHAHPHHPDLHHRHGHGGEGSAGG